MTIIKPPSPPVSGTSQQPVSTTDARSTPRLTPGITGAHDLEPGSLGAKAEAASRFAEAIGRAATTGSLDKATAVVNGRSGTEVRAAAATLERPRQPSPRRIARGGS
jgi:hypothetical protein